ncbi:MAG: zinc-ribbon domain-containing protein [Ruminococcaceae bacterium]|nr:zinc-ribbon domain-containing protein [Oscillospiraceae bacterium]
MFCPNCGKEILDNAYVCVHCGVKTPGVITVRAKEPVVPGKGLGIFSMIMGILSIACCSGFGTFPIVGLITGIVAKSKAKAAGMENSYATAGIICSSVTIALALLGLIFYIVYIIFVLVLGVGAASTSYYY